MNDKQIEQLGEFPHYDNDIGATNRQFTRKIRERVLSGDYPADSLKETQMLRDFKASKLTIAEYVAHAYPNQ